MARLLKKELAKENVVDYKKEGRNKTYFLKKTIEAKNYISTAENYRLNQILKKYPHLRGIIGKIQKDSRIKLAILFGSYAKRTFNDSSDIDVAIILKEKSSNDELLITDIIDKLNKRFKKEIQPHYYTAKEFDKPTGRLMAEIVRDGIMRV